MKWTRQLYFILMINFPKIFINPPAITDGEEKENRDGDAIDGEKIDEREPEE